MRSTHVQRSLANPSLFIFVAVATLALGPALSQPLPASSEAWGLIWGSGARAPWVFRAALIVSRNEAYPGFIEYPEGNSLIPISPRLSHISTRPHEQLFEKCLLIKNGSLYSIESHDTGITQSKGCLIIGVQVRFSIEGSMSISRNLIRWM